MDKEDSNPMETNVENTEEQSHEETTNSSTPKQLDEDGGKEEIKPSAELTNEDKAQPSDSDETKNNLLDQEQVSSHETKIEEADARQELAKNDNEKEDDDNEDGINLSEELAKAEDESFGSLSDEEICDALNNDTWIEELECALLADCDPATLKKISEGRRIPSSLRPDYWRTLLALNDAGKVKLNTEYDLPNQLEIRTDCERLVEDISANLAKEPLSDADKLRLISDYESTLTTYVKARPELNYSPDNGWIDILRVLYNLELNVSQLYQIFFRIVDRYIPKDLSRKPVHYSHPSQQQPKNDTQETPNQKQTSNQNKRSSNLTGDKNHQSNNSSIPQNFSSASIDSSQKDYERSTQAYHLLRLLIQYHDPELCSILDSRKVTPDLYVKDWFSSLFARSCPSKVALLIWDTHFKMADPFLIFFAAIVMVVNASDELKASDMTQNKMLTVLKSMPSRLEEDDIEDLYYLVSNHYTNSTPRSIRSYSHLFFMDTFGNTYLGSESPEDGQPMVDLKTCRLTRSLDLSQYLCLPIVPAEIFALDTSQSKSSPTHSSTLLRYFLVDCRPAEQYNAGHLKKAFHLDCSLMLREPRAFATAVQALLEIQRQVVASKSNTGGRHLCFIGSGQEEEDQYVNMVVASFLQKSEKYVSIVHGGFDAIHDYIKTKSELKKSFNKYIVDHNEELCKACYSKSPEGIERFKAATATSKPTTIPTTNSSSYSSSGFSSAQSLFASTTSFLRGDRSTAAGAASNLLSQSSVSMLDNFSKAFLSKTNVIKDKLVETLQTTNIPSAATLSSMTSNATGRSHVSSQDKLGKRYMGSAGGRFEKDDFDFTGRRRSKDDAMSEPVQEIQLDSWLGENKILASFKCSQIKGTARYPGYIALSKTHLWILREIPHNKGFATIAAQRPLDMIVQITSKRKQPDFIIFRYGYANHQSQQQKAQQLCSTQSNDSSATDSPSSPDEFSGSSSSTKIPLDGGGGGGLNLPPVIASDHVQIPQAFEVIRLIKREIVRIMDESANKTTTTESPKPDGDQKNDDDDGVSKEHSRTEGVVEPRHLE